MVQFFDGAPVLDTLKMTLKIENLNHSYGDMPVLKDIHLEVQQGEVVCLLGASGSGKSTLLRIIAGLEPQQSGTLMLNEEVVATAQNSPSPEARHFGMVFQDHVLFPHMSVLKNTQFGLSDLAESDRNQVAIEALSSVGLAEFAERYPHTLSGGQQQRVALARALAPKPRVMLLDEPFASVDTTLRRQLREDTRQALKDSQAPSVIVTHDAEEAMELADRIVVIDGGSVVQSGTPEDVWAHPSNKFVAELFTGSDAISGVVAATGVETQFGRISGPTQSLSEGQTCNVVIRPNDIQLRLSKESTVQIRDIRFLSGQYLLLLSAGGESLRVTTSELGELNVGDNVEVAFKAEEGFVFALTQ